MRQKIHRAILSVSIAFLSGVAMPAKAQEAQRYTLKQCIEYGLANRGSLKNANLDVQIAQSQVKELVGTGLPQINGTVSYTNFLEIPTSLIPGEFFGAPAGSYIPVKFGTKHSASAGADASQLLFNSSYLIGVKASKAFVDLSRKAVDTAEIAIVEGISKAYYGVVINEQRKTLLEANVIRLQKTFEELQAINKEGFVEQLDVDRLKVSLNNLTVEKNKVDQLVGLSYYLLKFQMGMPFEQNLALADSIVAPSTRTPIARGSASPTNRPEYALLQMQRNLAALDLKRYQYAYLPTVVAIGSYTTNAMRQEFNFFDGKGQWFPTAIIGGSISIPIFDGFQKAENIKQARYTVSKVDNGIAEITNAFNLQIDAARVMFNNALLAEQTSKESLGLAQQIVKTTQIKYQEGVGSNLEVVSAETDLKTAQTDYYTALYELILADIEYQKASGQLKK